MVCGLPLQGGRGGPNLHLSCSTASGASTFYIDPPSTFVAHVCATASMQRGSGGAAKGWRRSGPKAVSTGSPARLSLRSLPQRDAIGGAGWRGRRRRSGALRAGRVGRRGVRRRLNHRAGSRALLGASTDLGTDLSTSESRTEQLKPRKHAGKRVGPAPAHGLRNRRSQVRILSGALAKPARHRMAKRFPAGARERTRIGPCPANRR